MAHRFMWDDTGRKMGGHCISRNVLSHNSAEGMAHSPEKSHSSFSENDEPQYSLDRYITCPVGI